MIGRRRSMPGSGRSFGRPLAADLTRSYNPRLPPGIALAFPFRRTFYATTQLVSLMSTVNMQQADDPQDPLTPAPFRKSGEHTWQDARASEMCKAVSRLGTYEVRLVDVPVPDIAEEKDVVVKVTAWHGGESGETARWTNRV